MSTVDVCKEEKKFSWEVFFSALCARLFFVLLLVFDLLWFVYLLLKHSAYSLLLLLFWRSSRFWQSKLSRNWVSLKRAVLCALSLLIALFSPAFGVMIACTYFLMYDKNGIEEVVPASLREQFKDLFASAQDAD